MTPRRPSGPRVRAPELTPPDATWFGVETPLTLAGLRGRFVLLDFWSSCCGNCLHVLDELRPVERDRDDVLTVVGVHSPKFPHEAEPATVAAAVARSEIGHPVVNDPTLHLWRQYAVRAWPTLVLVDPEGYVVAQAAGEGQVDALMRVVDDLLPAHERRGTLRRGTGPWTPPPLVPGDLRFPASAVVLPAGRTGRDHDTVLVADAGHHQLVELDADATTVLRRIGSGTRGAPFTEPHGVALLPPGTPVPYDVVVADTGAHVLRGVRLADGEVTTTLDLPAALAGATTVTGPVPGVLSPWDVAWWPALGRLVVAAAGVHLLLAVDPADGTVEVLAGTTVEALRDGPAADAWLAQPSGLAVDGERLWFVDAETSALRWLTVGGTVHTAVGEGLFDFGHVDGPAAPGGVARMQHPLGVLVLPDGTIGVLDTYNGAVRRYDPSTRTVSTLARDLAEPSGAVLVDGALVVVESAAHRLVRPVADLETVSGTPLRTERPVTALRAGPVTLAVRYSPPPGRTLDERYGPSTRLDVDGDPAMLVAGAGDGTALVRDLTLAAGDGVLSVTAQAASCDDDPGAEHPVCVLARQDWGIPVVVRDDGTGADRLELVLLG